MEDKIIGVVWRFGNNDYQISLTEFEEKDQAILMDIISKYEDKCSCERGNEQLSIADANVRFWEFMWDKK